MADETGAEVVVEAVVEKDALTIAQERIAQVEEERDNYKAVALKRLGKLPGDAEFLDRDGNGELTVKEQVRLELLDREVEMARREEKDATAKIIRTQVDDHDLGLILREVPG